MTNSIFSKSKVTVTGRVTRVDGTTSEITGTGEMGRWRSFLLRLLTWARRYGRGE